MTNNIIVLQQLIDKAGPSLRVWAYADWSAWFVVILALIVAGYYARKHPIEWLENEGLPQITHWIFWGFAGLLLVFFIPWTFHVFTTPELSAIQDLLKK